MRVPKIGRKPVLIVEGDRLVLRQARWDGNPARPPRNGELYLSGAEPVAYRATADYDTEYFIAEEILP